MKLSRAVAGLVLSLASVAPADAFDTQTHAYITYHAYLNSDLGNGNAAVLLQRLGLGRLGSPQPFSSYWLGLPLPLSAYFDNTPTGTMPLQYQRPPMTYEWVQMQQLADSGLLGTDSSTVVGPNSIQTLPISNWLIRGSIREDDLTPSYYNPVDGPAPDPDPHGDILRSLKHFYDPIHDSPLHVLTDLGEKSLDWALGTTDAFTSLAPDNGRRQHFGWADARNNYWWALTAERDANNDGVRSAAEREADSAERLYRWATTFRALGNVVHLLEDAAQPQHTRNDRHDTHASPDDRQGFEPFTNARLIGKAATTSATPTGGQVYVRSLISADASLFQQFLTPLPNIDGYAPPIFTTALRFFTTRAPSDDENTSPDGRLGMADYSNRGFFSRGTTPDTNPSLPGVFSHSRPTPTLAGFTTQTTNCPFLPKLRGQPVSCTTYLHAVPDPVAPSRPDATVAQPLLAEGMWKGFIGSANQYTLTPQIYQATANLAVPRAIAYSAGILNYFFRGKLAVSAPPDKIVAVLNQGAQHTMNAQGYPCVGTASNDGCPVFGFQTIRVNVQNLTTAITEPNAGTAVAQKLSATAAGDPSDPGFTGPALVAIARYHRNTCYKPDLSGERQQAYATPPTTGLITEPTCSSGQIVRTPYQETSVSKSLAVSAATLNGAAFEGRFDFAADPIPVNATDLFVQIVYRGPMGDTGAMEPDAIAMGTLDVREPLFAAYWNNTDYFWNGSAWVAHNAVNRDQGIQSFWVCAGGAPVKMIFEYNGAVGSPAMIDPVVNANVPGMARLGVVVPPPDFPGQAKSLRGVPTHYPGDALIALNSGSTTGMFKQGNIENLSAATLSSPQSGCTSMTTGGPAVWCSDPIQTRRGQRFGAPALPLAIALFGGLSNATDVDSLPLPAFSGSDLLSTGVIRFDTDATLANCATQPASISSAADYKAYLHYVSLLEEARNLGVNEGE